ncbi:MAG: metallophosphoesterase [Acidobacteriota bacterium]
MRSRLAVLILCALFVFETYGAQSQPPQSPRQRKSYRALIARLKPSLREMARSIIAETDEQKRAQMVAKIPPSDISLAMDFLLALLADDPSARVRSAIIEALARLTHQKVRLAFERLAASDPDDAVSLLALERLRVQRSREMNALLVRRIDLARRNKDEKGLRRLAQEHERWISLTRGTMLPSFLRTPPDVFSLKAETEGVRVLAFGDFGVGFGNQKSTASAMLEVHRAAPFDFAITLGDNFYNEGLMSPADSRLKALWDELYDPFGIRFYAVLGNHDWRLSDSPAAEILYAQRSPSWRMPSPYYTFTAGRAQFFALDTNEISEAQLLWLDEAMAKSSAQWKIVYGHHPIYNVGEHGDDKRLIERLLPMLKGRVDIYLAGHDHNLQHLKPESGVHFFVCGGGGARLYKVKADERSLFAQSTNGFAVIEADARELKVQFVDKDSKPLYQYTIRKGEEVKR